jgi:hypothetical protein
VGGVIANVAGSLVYLIVTAALFRASHAARTAVISHAVRVAVLVTFAGTLPIVLIALPTTAAYAAAVPLTIVWTLVGFRLPLLRVNHATLVGLTEGVVPARIARLVAQRWAQLLIGGVSPHATQS